ncbi:MAG: helix-turn-helix domain-containing protein [Lactobacillus iners]|uniref:helix-turn-helix domain-containing protein n=1 Tax=Lactobacillus iners TaxID=147802 RepID=UPI001F09CDC7|nr:helix-turn-helix domain-containing protein [Lactobacillus iners]MCT7778070.1 helix-turn-helix domain-containing protein [Lactobacillus iners]MCT7826687.1 helix-turn-helix domain-containing protein [Lactobacillus iners]MCT7882890.1 helix-turn-helix domain-containing protein [Lactobacillus iners]MCT7889970.1 helix-turn-helix domain-containing protein [Lactobacillus iners]
MISGEKLKKLRLMRNLTQKELAIKYGLTDAAIRNYELENRSPSKEQLQKISEKFDCDISALINHEPNSIFEIMHIIFDYEKDMKFRPSADTGEITGLLSNDVDFNNFLIEWN